VSALDDTFNLGGWGWCYPLSTAQGGTFIATCTRVWIDQLLLYDKLCFNGTN